MQPDWRGGASEGLKNLVVKARASTCGNQHNAELEPVSEAATVSTLYAAVSSFLPRRHFWERLCPHIFTVKELENKRKNMESVEKNTTEGIPENSLSTCKMRQGSACSTSLGKTEAWYLLRGDLCRPTKWTWKKPRVPQQKGEHKERRKKTQKTTQLDACEVSWRFISTHCWPYVSRRASWCLSLCIFKKHRGLVSKASIPRRGRGSNSLLGVASDPASHNTCINVLKSVPHQVLLKPQFGHWVWSWKPCFREERGDEGWAQSWARGMTKGWHIRPARSNQGAVWLALNNKHRGVLKTDPETPREIYRRVTHFRVMQ